MSLGMRRRRTLYTQDDDNGDHDGDEVEEYNRPTVQAWCYDNDNVIMRMMLLKTTLKAVMMTLLDVHFVVKYDRPISRPGLEPYLAIILIMLTMVLIMTMLMRRTTSRAGLVPYLAASKTAVLPWKCQFYQTFRSTINYHHHHNNPGSLDPGSLAAFSSLQNEDWKIFALKACRYHWYHR